MDCPDRAVKTGLSKGAAQRDLDSGSEVRLEQKKNILLQTGAVMAAAGSDPGLVTDLRARIAALEGLVPLPGVDGDTGSDSSVVSLALISALAPLDAGLPWGGLPRGALHEVITGDDGAGIAAAAGFAALLLARLAEAAPASRILWVCRAGCGGAPPPYGPALDTLGLDPARLLFVRAQNDRDVLWAVEESLHCPGLVAVLGEVREAGLSATRRLQLAAEASGITALLLRPLGAVAAEQPPASTAVTRWRISSLPAAGHTDTAVDAPRWALSLLRCRGGRPRDWIIDLATKEERHHAPTHRLTFPATPGHGPDRARAAAE